MSRWLPVREAAVGAASRSVVPEGRRHPMSSVGGLRGQGPGWGRAFSVGGMLAAGRPGRDAVTASCASVVLA